MSVLGSAAYPFSRAQQQHPKLATYAAGSGAKSLGTSVSLPDLVASKGGRKQGLAAEVVVKKSPSELVLERQQFGALHGWADVHKPRIQAFMDLSSFSHHTHSVVPADVPLFSIDPPMVTFSDFQGLQVYEAPLIFRNQDTVARRVKVFPPDSPYFELMPKRSKGASRGSGGSSGGDKVAPGMEVCYIVRFKPDARIDYSYDLTVITEREKFIVPIRASGGSAILEFPDVIDFGAECVVGHEIERTVLVQNIGDGATKFMISATPPFSCSPPSSRIAEGGSVQVDVRFRPDRAETYEGELHLKYGELEAYVVLCGAARNAEVSLSHSHLVVDDTYIGLETQGVVTIRNDSDVPIEFTWRLFASVAEEALYRQALHNQLKVEERDETLFLSHSPLSDDSEEDSCSDDERLRARRDAKVTNATGRKYGSIRKAIDEDAMLYHDPTFAIEPRTGRVWSHSQLTCAVCFRPKEADCYSGTAYLSCVGQEERAPLVMKGLGIGPKATFSYDELDVANVFVESIHRYEVQLLNQGDVEVDFRILPNDSKFSHMFKFTPDSGIIRVGGQCEIIVDFHPTELGAFHVIFECVLKGSATSVNLGFRGTVVQPTFEFDTDRLNFGIVSYAFLNSRMLTLTNTAEVPMNYTLHVPRDDNNEFEIVPSRGMLLPGCTQRVQVDFVSMTEKKYEHKLAVDLEGIGKEIYSIPVTAQCAVPTVTFEPHGTINYGDVFIRYPFHQSLYLHNTSNLPAKFEVLAPEDPSKADFEPDQWTGSMPPCASHVITLTLTTRSQGPLKLPVYVRILGRPVPFPLVLTANSIGPRVVVDPPMLEWGSVKCLEPSTRHVKITNQSCIDASVRAFMHDRRSLWSVHPKVIHLSPQETLQLALTLKIDETSGVHDMLNLVVNEGEDLQVQVKGHGVETPVICDQDLACVDFGTLFTTHQESREITVRNYGRRARRISWLRQKEPKENKRSAPDAPKDKDEKPPPPVIFRVEPESAIIDPKTAFRFTFVATSQLPGVFEDYIACIEKLEKEATAGKQIYKPQVKATFVEPQLTLSRSEITFDFRLERDKPIDIISEQLTLENNCELDVSFKVLVKHPFSASVEEGTIPSQGKMDMVIEFDPAYKTDRNCGTIRERLVVVYDDHPATNAVELVGNVMWPNLELDTNKLDFGTILNDTSRAMEVKLKNPTALVVSYSWCLTVKSIESENQAAVAALAASTRGSPGLLTPQETKSSLKSTALGVARFVSAFGGGGGHAADDGSSTMGGPESAQEHVEVNQVFDLLPIFGTLQPGETQTTTFTYTGLRDRSFKAFAVCSVEGGPEYEVMLLGSAATCKFNIDKQELDFGDLPFMEVGKAELNLRNPGKIPLSFSFNLVQMSRPNVVEFSPSSGVLDVDGKPKSTQRVIVRFRAGIPADVCETVLLEVAHFEPFVVRILGRGIFLGIVVGLPRLNEAEHAVALAAAKLRMANKRQSLMGPTDAAGSLASDSQVGVASPALEAAGQASGTSEHVGSSGAAAGERLVPSATDHAELSEGASMELTDVEPEFEVDRYYLCETLLQNPEKAAAVTQSTARTSMARGFGKKRSEATPATAAQYRLDFGTMALGQSVRREVNIYNSGYAPVLVAIDTKLLKDHGFYPEPEGLPKLLPRQKVTIALTAMRSREEPEGLVELEWNIPVQGGPNYKIFISANFVLPDLQVSPKLVDFGRVLLGRRKRMSLEIANTKAVPVEWCVDEPRDRIGRVVPAHARTFEISPMSGILKPEERQILTLSFTPYEAKQLSRVLRMRLRDNRKVKGIQVSGRGERLQLHVQPSLSYKLGPVMPNEDATCELFLCNPADYPIEVYSVEWDQRCLEEEQMLVKYDGYVGKFAELPVRKPGERLWKQVRRRVAEIHAEETGEPLQFEDEDDEEAKHEEAGQHDAQEAAAATTAAAAAAAAAAAEAPATTAAAATATATSAAASQHEGIADAHRLSAEENDRSGSAGHGDGMSAEGGTEEAESNEPLLPPPVEVQLVTAPQPEERPEQVVPTNFSIITPTLEAVKRPKSKDSHPPEDGRDSKTGKGAKEKADKDKERERAAGKDKKGKAEKPSEASDGSEEDAEEVEMVERLVPNVTRWILDAGQQQRLLVKFQSQEVAEHASTLQFAAVDDVGFNPVAISMQGIAALPGISIDPRTIFKKHRKRRPAGGYGNKTFITSLGIYDFGTLPVGRDPECRKPPPSPSTALAQEQIGPGEEAHQIAKDAAAAAAGSGVDSSAEEEMATTDAVPPHVSSQDVLRHLEVIHLTNTSLLPADVMLSLASADLAAKEQVHEPPPPPVKKGKKHEEPPPPPPPPPPVFIVEPESLHLQQGEAAEVHIWCFPQENGLCEDTLTAHIAHNPEPLCFGLCALGSAPDPPPEREEADLGPSPQ